MTDTPDHIYQMQYEIIASKPMSERIQLGFDTIDTTRNWIENSIRQTSPEINPSELAIAVFLRSCIDWIMTDSIFENIIILSISDLI
jgi:hypothetical protein